MKEQKKDFKKLDKQLEKLRLASKNENESPKKPKPKFNTKVRVLKEVGLLNDSISLLEKEDRRCVKIMYRYYMDINLNLAQILRSSASIMLDMRNMDAYPPVINKHIEDICKCLEEIYITETSIRCLGIFNTQFEKYSNLKNCDIIGKCTNFMFKFDYSTIGLIIHLFNEYMQIRNKTPRNTMSIISKPDGEFGMFVRKFFEDMCLDNNPKEQKSTDLKTMISSEKGSFNCKLIIDIENVQKPFIEKSLEIYRDLCEELFMDVLGKLGVETLQQFALKDWFKSEEIPALIYIDDDNYYVHLMDPSSGSVTSLKSYLTTHLWDGMKVSFAVAGISKSLYRTFYNKWSSRISIDPYLGSVTVLQ